MERVAALVVAIVMVVAALVIRARIDESDDSDGTAQLVCAEELRAACLELDDAVGGLEVTIEPAGTTAARLVGLPDTEVNDPGFDGWLVPEPWPGIVAGERDRGQLRPVLDTNTDLVGRSPLVIMARRDRERVLATGVCESVGVEWPCLGDVAGDAWASLDGQSTWGQVKTGHTNPTVNAIGLLVLAQATSEFLDDTLEYSRADLDDEAYRVWLRQLESTRPTAVSPAVDMLREFPTAVYDFVGTVEAEAGPALNGASPDRRDAFALLYPEPVATADVVLSLAASSDRDQDIEDLAGGGTALDALAGNGWRVDGEPLAPGLDRAIRLRNESNLPEDPGLYEALQDVWEQEARA